MSISTEKFSQQSMPRQLGALAANLARISSCARWKEPGDIVIPMMTESIQFAEWIAPHTPAEITAELVDLQIRLSLWQKIWPQAQGYDVQRTLLSFQARKWSDQMLEYSGLLNVN